jgi:hypothetical protein
MSRERPRDMGSRGREAMVTPIRSRLRIAGKRKEPENQGRYPNPMRDADQMESLEGYEGSGSGQRAACDPAIHNVEIGHGG